jgi:Zn-dependent oligopeptidase
MSLSKQVSFTKYADDLHFNYTAEEITERTTLIINKFKEADDKLASIPLEQVTFSSAIVPYLNIENEVANEIKALQFLMNVSPDKEIRDASMKSKNEFEKYDIESQSNYDIYQRFKNVQTNDKEFNKLSEIDQRLINRVIRDHYERNGINITDSEKKDELKKLQTELSDLSIKFSRNINEGDGKALFTKEELEGMPDDFLSSHETEKDESDNNIEKYIVTTKYPDYFPTMKLCKNSDTRYKLYFIYNTRCKENVDILQKVIKLRHQIANVSIYIFIYI